MFIFSFLWDPPLKKLVYFYLVFIFSILKFGFEYTFLAFFILSENE